MWISLMLVLGASPADAGSTPKLHPAHVDGRWGYIDRKGRFKVEPAFEDAQPFSEGLAGVRVDGRWGYIDRKGRWVVPATYARVAPFHEGLAAVQQQGLVGFIDPAGALVIEPRWATVDNFHDGRALVQQGDVYGFIDTAGALAIPLELPWAQPFREGLAPVSRSGEAAGFMDVNGTMVVSEDFLKVGNPGDGRLAVSRDGLAYSYLDTEGNEVIPGPYTEAADFSDGRAWVVVDGQVRLIDTDGEVVSTPVTTERGPFSEGLAAVRVDGKVGFIGVDGTLALEPIWDDTTGFSGTVGFVRDGLVWRAIDRRGRVVWSDGVVEAPPEVVTASSAWVDAELFVGEGVTGASVVGRTGALLGSFDDVAAAVDAARVHPGGEVVVPLRLDSARHWVLLAASETLLPRDLDYASSDEALSGWLFVEPDLTAEQMFRSRHGRAPTARGTDALIDDFLEEAKGAGAVMQVPLVRAYGSLVDEGFAGAVMVNRFAAP